jgi:hypothetical protein
MTVIRVIAFDQFHYIGYFQQMLKEQNPVKIIGIEVKGKILILLLGRL